MKAAFLTGVLAPFEVRDTPVPTPGPSQVRVRVYGSGVCGTDAHYWTGVVPISLPRVLGHEPVGVVEALGEGCRWLRVGDRVGVSWVQAGCGRCRACQRRKTNFCADQRTWMGLGGGHAEYVIAEEEGCTLLPEGLAWDVAAPLFCGGYTVMSGYRAACPRPGERVAVLGIGGLGHLAIQIAKALGHEVIAVTANADKRKEALALGADAVLVIQDHGGRELSAMGGADIVLGTSNSMTHTSQLVEGLRPEGRLVSMGIARESLSIDPLRFLDLQLSILGGQQTGREHLVEVLELAAAGKVRPRIEPYRLEDIQRVMERLREGKVRHRAVLMMGG